MATVFGIGVDPDVSTSSVGSGNGVTELRADGRSDGWDEGGTDAEIREEVLFEAAFFDVLVDIMKQNWAALHLVHRRAKLVQK